MRPFKNYFSLFINTTSISRLFSFNYFIWNFSIFSFVKFSSIDSLATAVKTSCFNLFSCVSNSNISNPPYKSHLFTIFLLLCILYFLFISINYYNIGIYFVKLYTKYYICNFYFSCSLIKYINKNRVVQKLNLNLEQLY